MPTKDPVLSVRLPKDLEARLSNASKQLDLSKNDIARHAIRAAVAAIEANDFRIVIPLEMDVKKIHSKQPVDYRNTAPAEDVALVAERPRNPPAKRRSA